MTQATTEQQDRLKVKDKKLHDKWSFLVFVLLVALCIGLHIYESGAKDNYDAATVCRVVKTLERQEQYGSNSYVEIEYRVNGRTLNAERPTPAISYSNGDCFNMRYARHNPAYIQVNWTHKVNPELYGK